ncbi:hypothetical protein [Curtobacterium sp. MCPF17_052]|uniref:hypothetical protein n=1 Tax=Curtobacterium sp. MCPF17_052 TaxID=2175655 RepID=UPI0024DFCB8F|nr:hypothetical protein [Curtobacterium sp. MCPF17_052]WIB13144.1 hypothetical protein DEJ36_04320 [Curtobacterium sp. MCPF17_052]
MAAPAPVTASPASTHTDPAAAPAPTAADQPSHAGTPPADAPGAPAATPTTRPGTSLVGGVVSAVSGASRPVTDTVVTVLDPVTGAVQDIAGDRPVTAIVAVVDRVVGSLPVVGGLLGDDALGTVTAPVTGVVDDTLGSVGDVVGAVPGVVAEVPDVVGGLPGVGGGLLPGGSLPVVDVPSVPVVGTPRHRWRDRADGPGRIGPRVAHSHRRRATRGDDQRSGSRVGCTDHGRSGPAGCDDHPVRRPREHLGGRRRSARCRDGVDLPRCRDLRRRGPRPPGRRRADARTVRGRHRRHRRRIRRGRLGRRDPDRHRRCRRADLPPSPRVTVARSPTRPSRPRSSATTTSLPIEIGAPARHGRTRHRPLPCGRPTISIRSERP